MSDDLSSKIEAIWADDLLGRRPEAQLIIDYLESVWARPSTREDLRSFTLAVDVGYGEGKSFFLTRLAKHLQLTHPVAFVDAWAEDTLDQPLTALAATLELALDPLKSEPSIRDKLSEVLKKVGGVTKAVGMGALRRGAAVLLTEAGVEGVAKALGAAPEQLAEAGKAAAAVGDDVVNAVATQFSGVAPGQLMQDRIKEFRTGKAAIEDLKDSLHALVEALKGQSLAPPIVIVVDELDRCRPAYAVKLLEEVKHLFDVPGVIFIFGMHGDQLSLALGSAYSPQFNGRDYLKRFVGRRYELKRPNLRPLLAKLLSAAALDRYKILPYFTVRSGQFSDEIPELDDLVARYMKLYELNVRDAYHVVDSLQTSVALSGGKELYAPYLLPLLMSRIRGANRGQLLPPPNNGDWEYVARESLVHGGAASTHSP